MQLKMENALSPLFKEEPKVATRNRADKISKRKQRSCASNFDSFSKDGAYLWELCAHSLVPNSLQQTVRLLTEVLFLLLTTLKTAVIPAFICLLILKRNFQTRLYEYSLWKEK